MLSQRSYFSRRLFLLIFLALIFNIALLSVPIKWTPVVALIPSYRTWHSVSTVHLLTVLSRSLPRGVSPKTFCSQLKDPGVSKSDLKHYSVVFHSISRTKEIIKRSKKELHTDLTRFLPITNKNTKTNLLHTYLVLKRSLEKAGVAHSILHGALLGVYRFSGISAWDDDIDVGVNVSMWTQVRDALSCIKGFELNVDPQMRWSFFPSNGRSTYMENKKYPFVDIFFYAEDETHVWGLHFVNRRRSLFPKSLMFPLTRGKMEGITVPIPRDTKAILELQYGDLGLCTTQSVGHLAELNGTLTVPCSMLHGMYGEFNTS